MSSEKAMVVKIPPQLTKFLGLTNESTIETYMENDCLFINVIDEYNTVDIPANDEHKIHVIRTTMPVRILYKEYKEYSEDE